VLPVLAFAMVPSQARAQAPDAVGWWNAAHRSTVPVAPPAPPDVAAGDLLLQGGDVQRELPDTQPAPTAYAALRYAVPEGATVTALTLQVADGAQASDIRAYATTATWQPVENGAIDDAPAPDLSRYAVATLTGTTLTFSDIGKLATDDGVLSVVLMPGVGDRVVVHSPTATALTVSEPPTRADTAYVPPPPPAGPVLPALTPAPAVAIEPPSAALVPPAPQTAPSVALPSPQPAAAPVAAAVRRVVADDARTRGIVVLEALLVAVFFGLLGLGPLARLARLTGQTAAVTGERGVGRFRAVRVGRAPRL